MRAWIDAHAQVVLIGVAVVTAVGASLLIALDNKALDR
ncbi:hypothetical protein SEA_BIG4_313 [Microbacterium phage Big4]|nr:hypothetical protein SEA_BIG4_313 [Microbacterium phage Big4]